MLKATTTFSLLAPVFCMLAANAAENASLPEESGDQTDQALFLLEHSAEELIVSGAPVDPFKPHNFEYMQRTYDVRGQGSCLYRKGQYAESFPYLLAAAKRGFKFAQARLSFLYERGLGTERNTEAALGWLSVAASGTSHPAIRNRHRDMWRRIPDEHLPHFERVAEDYRAKYSAPQHRVSCDLSPQTYTHIHALTCRFIDDAIFLDAEYYTNPVAWLTSFPRTTPPDPAAKSC
ncbi:MAG: sel1 repeat family protein [Gammaproteobacteria bacterium]|nr:sel1 repeat family protein [Gammaproteobacteria bacterium]